MKTRVSARKLNMLSQTWARNEDVAAAPWGSAMTLATRSSFRGTCLVPSPNDLKNNPLLCIDPVAAHQDFDSCDSLHPSYRESAF